MAVLSSTTVPTASPVDTLKVLAAVMGPTIAKGAIARRPRVLAAAQRLDTDARAVQVLARLRDEHGGGPLMLPIPGRRTTFVLEPDDVHRVLDGSPVPFRLDTREKRGALEHFQPDGVLVSSPAERMARRTFNEAVLDTGSPLHRSAGPMTAAVQDEARLLLAEIGATTPLTWDRFARAWWRAVRRVVLGDAARDDDAVTDLLLQLRRDANWTFLRPSRDATRRRFFARLQEHLDRAEPGSLAELVARTPAVPGTEKTQQVPQWLFAFDATAWASYRALALLASQPGAAERARSELGRAPDLPYLRACLLESLRLWPTTPAILRETSADTDWRNGRLPAGSSVVVFAPLFHRDESRLPEAHRFCPELWLRERTAEDWPLVPFSGGPGMCPGRNVVLLTASVLLATLLAEHDLQVTGADLPAGGPLPGTVSPFGLEFRLRRMSGAVPG
jgi:cytochrome P450